MMDRTKQGFGVPIHEWLRSDMSYLLDKYLNRAYIREQNIFDYEELSVILNNF